MLNQHARILARAGVALFVVSLANGFLVHAVALQRQALSAHLVGLIRAAFLIALASLWKQLDLTNPMSRAGSARRLWILRGLVLQLCGGPYRQVWGISDIDRSLARTRDRRHHRQCRIAECGSVAPRIRRDRSTKPFKTDALMEGP